MPISEKKHVLRTLVTASILLVTLLVLVMPPIPRASAVSNSQIDQLQAQIDQYQNEASRLNAEGNSLQATLDQLAAEKNVIQTQLSLSQAKHDQVVADIAATEKKLTAQQLVLAEAIGDLSMESETSPIEMLAGSGSIGDYLDQYEYQASIRDQLDSSIKRVKDLKKQLSIQREEVAKLIAEQTAHRDQLAAKEQEQAALVAKTRGEEASYQGLVSQLKAQKAAAEAALARSLGSGSYRVAPVGPVGAGSVVGAVGNSGLSSGPHLHLEARSGGGVTNPGSQIETSPIDMPPGYVSQSYGNPDPMYARGYHPGVDYATNQGAPIYAISGGFLYRGCSNQMLGTSNNEYGYVAIVEHANGVRSVYAHMSGGPAQCSYNTYY